MSTIITRLFESHEQAMAAVADLKRHIPAYLITVVAPPNLAAGAPDTTYESLRAAEVPDTAAKAYAERARRGGTVVSVRAPFGLAATASEVLERFHPTEIGVSDSYQPTTGRAAPLSDAFGLPLLSSSPAPLSRMLGMRVLSTGDRAQAKLVDHPAPFSRLFGLPLLSEGPEKKSSSLGMPLLSNKAAPLSSLFGMPLLTRGPEKKSSSFGLPLLSRNPAPLSSLIGLPVLLRD